MQIYEPKWGLQVTIIQDMNKCINSQQNIMRGLAKVDGVMLRCTTGFQSILLLGIYSI